MLSRMSTDCPGQIIKEDISMNNVSLVPVAVNLKQDSPLESFSQNCIPHIKQEPVEDDAEETLPKNTSTDDPLTPPSTVRCKEEMNYRVEPVMVVEAQDSDIDAAHRTSGGADARRCKHCSYQCLGQAMLDKHVKYNHGHIGRDGKYKCGICAYSTDISQNLTKHQHTHTGERPFPCDKCNKAFTQQSNLKQHIRMVHDGLRPYSCGVCGKAFAAAAKLTAHQRIHTGTVVVQCEQCGRQFNDHSTYSVHMKLHNDVKAHKCHVCSARFMQRGHLVEHIRTHTGERPFACSHCEARFTQNASLKSHVIAVHTHNYKHRCERCGKGFVDARGLRRHSNKCLL